MTYATLFMPDGRLALSLLTRAEGGPFVVEYTPVAGDELRCAGNAEWMLWNYVRDHAPGVFRCALAEGIVDGAARFVEFQRSGRRPETKKDGSR